MKESLSPRNAIVKLLLLLIGLGLVAAGIYLGIVKKTSQRFALWEGPPVQELEKDEANAVGFK